ncbi:unnamed protein product, partial [Pleuronectes platessa]
MGAGRLRGLQQLLLFGCGQDSNLLVSVWCDRWCDATLNAEYRPCVNAAEERQTLNFAFRSPCKPVYESQCTVSMDSRRAARLDVTHWQPRVAEVPKKITHEDRKRTRRKEEAGEKRGKRERDRKT